MRSFFAPFLLALMTCTPAAAQVGALSVQSAAIIASGGTVGRTVADRAGDALDIKDFGAKCDGSTDDTAAFATAFALSAPTTIHLPTGTCRISGAPLVATSAVSVVGNGRGVSIIQLAPGATPSGAVLSWSGQSNVMLRDFTLDLGGASASALIHAVSLTGGSGHLVNDIAIIGAGSSRWLLLALDGISNTVIERSIFSLPVPYTTQNQGINLSCSTASPTDIRILDNVLVNTGMDICASSSEINHNDISGWAFGGGITTEQNAASSKFTIIGNSVYNGATTIDENSTDTSGIENWAQNSLIADNLIWNNGGSGISQGGQQSLVIGNILWGNGQRSDGGGGSGIMSRNDNPTYNGAGSFISGNIAFGNGNASRAGQGYGYTEQTSGLTGIAFGVNSWAGPYGAYNVLGTAAGSLIPASLSAAGTISSKTSLVAAGANSLTLTGSGDNDWPAITSTAGLQFRVGPVAGIQYGSLRGGTNVTFSPNADQGQDNPAVTAGDVLVYYGVGSPDSGALTIAPWSNSSSSSVIRMTPYLTTLKNAVALTPSTPAGNSAACTPGQIGIDANYLYACTAANTWQSAPLLPFQTNPILAATTGSIGGSALAAGGCASATVSVPGATSAMAVTATPATYPGDGVFWHGIVSAAGTVTVKVCAAVAVTPAASAYNVRVLR
jgi:hypothetical protein